MANIETVTDSNPRRSGLTRRFRDLNVALSWAMTPEWLWRHRGFGRFERAAEQLMSGAGTILDAGGGRMWHLRQPSPQQRVIGMDIDGSELALNPVYSERIEADLCAKQIPVADGSIDLILARAVIEHLPDTRAFLNNAQRALRPGGHAVMAFANKWSLPMIVNRLLPNAFTKRLLMAFVPGTDLGLGGFRAHYDLCTPAAFRKAAADAGFEIVADEAGYYSSSYTQFFWPLHMVNITYDSLLQAADLRPLCATPMFVLRKPDGSQ